MTIAPWIEKGRPALVLAPMEGVTDAPMRALLCETGAFAFCVSEFLRISQDVPPGRIFREHVPELLHDARTPSGTRVQVQLLGGHPEKLALAATRAVGVGAQAIDLNFGCPAPVVNKHDGGAALLRHPGRIEDIVRTVRAALPPEIPLSAKLRLGWDTMEPIDENAARAAAGGASWITIHGRTKAQGYRAPAYWEPIGRVRQQLRIPVVANGEIWSLDDFKRCRDETGCEHYMLGRGALADPSLPAQIARELGLDCNASESVGLAPENWMPWLRRFREISGPFAPESRYIGMRIKQWLRLAGMKRPLSWFEAIKTIDDADQILTAMEQIASTTSA